MVLYVLNHRVSQNIEVVTCQLLKPQYSYKQANISFFVSHGPPCDSNFGLNGPVKVLGSW